MRQLHWLARVHVPDLENARLRVNTIAGQADQQRPAACQCDLAAVTAGSLHARDQLSILNEGVSLVSNPFATHLPAAYDRIPDLWRSLTLANDRIFPVGCHTDRVDVAQLVIGLQAAVGEHGVHGIGATARCLPRFERISVAFGDATATVAEVRHRRCTIIRFDDML